jgi:hypothetical protein
VRAFLLLTVVLAACGGGQRKPPAILPADVPYTFGRMERDGREVEAPVGAEINWPPDGGATVYLDGGIAQVRLFAQHTAGVNVNDGDVRRFFKKSLDKPRGPLMQEDRREVTIYCQESAPVIRGSLRLRLAACLRVDADTRKDGIITLAVFGAPEDRFEPLGGARVCAEILRSAKGFRP